MIPTYGLTHIALTVRDVERAFRFYQQVFGLEAYVCEPASIQAKTPGCHDVIVFNQGQPSPGLGGIAHFGFRLKSPADIGEAIDLVQRAGGRILRSGEFAPGVPYAFVSDPDGYEVEIWYE